MIVRTMAARCDALDCPSALWLDPGQPQPHVLLVRLGWFIVNTDDEIETYCPTHRPGVAS